MTEPVINIFKDRETLAEKAAIDFASWLKRLADEKDPVSIALSGGSTPTLFFRKLAALKPDIPWEKVRIFWVDERCVPPNDPESNFGIANAEFLQPLNIPSGSIHRIKGEDDPLQEAKRYGELILDTVAPDMTFPVFDLVFLGMGNDGHTASIFPHEKELWNEEALCTVGTHPHTGQKRVSFTGHLINGAAKVVFQVTGKEKSEIVTQVIKKSGSYQEFPASLVNPHHGVLEWYLDREAAESLKI